MSPPARIKESRGLLATKLVEPAPLIKLGPVLSTRLIPPRALHRRDSPPDAVPPWFEIGEDIERSSTPHQQAVRSLSRTAWAREAWVRCTRRSPRTAAAWCQVQRPNSRQLGRGHRVLSAARHVLSETLPPDSGDSCVVQQVEGAGGRATTERRPTPLERGNVQEDLANSSPTSYPSTARTMPTQTRLDSQAHIRA